MAVVGEGASKREREGGIRLRVERGWAGLVAFVPSPYIFFQWGLLLKASLPPLKSLSRGGNAKRGVGGWEIDYINTVWAGDVQLAE